MEKGIITERGFYMKKLMYKLNFAIVGIMASMPAFAAERDICELVEELQGVFKIMRTLAFVGAGFMIAKWAWEYIEKGKVDAMAELKGKGVAFLIGFILLFMIGAILTALSSAAGLESLGCVGTGWND